MDSSELLQSYVQPVDRLDVAEFGLSVSRGSVVLVGYEVAGSDGSASACKWDLNQLSKIITR